MHREKYSESKIDDECCDNSGSYNPKIQRWRTCNGCDMIMIVLWIWCRVTIVLSLISLYHRNQLFFYLLLPLSIVDAILNIIWSFSDYFYSKSRGWKIIIIVCNALLSIIIGPIIMFINLSEVNGDIEHIESKRLWLKIYGYFISLPVTILMIVNIAAYQDDTYYILLLISNILSMIILPCRSRAMPRILSPKQLIKCKFSMFDIYDRDLLFSGLLRAMLLDLNDTTLPSAIITVIKQFHGEFGVKFEVGHKIDYRYYDKYWLLATIKFHKPSNHKLSKMNSQIMSYLTETQRAMLLSKYDNLEGLLISYQLYEKEGYRMRWLFIERGSICDCYGECTDEFHQIGRPNMNKKAIINKHFNSDHVIIVRGNGSGANNYYCNRFIGVQTCGHDGYCGPHNGPQCESCSDMIQS